MIATTLSLSLSLYPLYIISLNKSFYTLEISEPLYYYECLKVSSFLTYASTSKAQFVHFWDSCEYIEPILFNLFILQYSQWSFWKYILYILYIICITIIQIKKAFITFNGADSCQL